MPFTPVFDPGKLLNMEGYARTSGSKYEYLLFDMDDTLYPLSTGINLACRKKIEEFMLHHLDIEASEVPKMCLDLYKEYGTTMAGLKALGYEFDNDKFHAYVHGELPYEKLRPDPALRNVLLSTPQRKIVFTNADKAHAARVLKRLCLEDCFDGIICFETLNTATNAKDGLGQRPARIVCKPSLESFEAAIRVADLDPEKTLFFDDSPRNITTAKIAGLNTVIVGSSALVPGADYALSSIHNIKEAIPEIWEGEGKQHGQVVKSGTVETMVLA